LPDLSRIDPAIVALAAILTVFTGIVAATALFRSARQQRSNSASLVAIDFVRTSFVNRLERGEPIDELLTQAVEELRDSLKLDAAQIWLTDSGDLDLAASDPRRDVVPIKLVPNVGAIVANARASGRPWASVWLPDLVPKRDEVAIRVAPIRVGGQLLGLIVIEREGHEERLAADADGTLEELAREIGTALNSQHLDTALHASMEQLRKQAQDLQASRGRIVAAADAERRRIERDLHDGAQQYLVAIAVKLGLVQLLADRDASRRRALLDDLMTDTQSALEELRSLAHGIYPALLSEAGLCDALAAACRRAALPTELHAAGIGRYQPELEAAVYFCCLEALQNAAKYAGAGASARVTVWEEAGGLLFEIRDDGAGFDAAHSSPGVGLTNMNDRLGAVGGRLDIESGPGHGTLIRGAVPLEVARDTH
jgi:signal transduction histidine kinase